MTKEAAAQIVPMLVQAAQLIADTVDVAQKHAQSTGEHVDRYSAAVGAVILSIDGLLRPLIQEHPDLHP